MSHCTNLLQLTAALRSIRVVFQVPFANAHGSSSAVSASLKKTDVVDVRKPIEKMVSFAFNNESEVRATNFAPIG